jgi:hypothetical protein
VGMGALSNVLSWHIRPLFLLPLAYFSYRRSLSGIVLALVALATSMFWFPAPERMNPKVEEAVPGVAAVGKLDSQRQQAGHDVRLSLP